jgi:hypothetical protein
MAGAFDLRTRGRTHIMLLTLIAAATVASAAPAQWTHEVAVPHGQGKANAVYVARPDVKLRQIGAAAGTRMSSERCLWTADINVERRLETPGVEIAGRREMPATKTLSGSRHGACMHQRSAIDTEIAAQAPAINAHLVEVAERDQRDLRSEIEALSPPNGR